MTIVWTNDARKDLARIHTFNSSRDPDHAERVDQRLWEVAAFIERDPWIGRPIAGPALRERSLSDIQYVVRYRVENREDDADCDIVILQVRHTRENREQPWPTT